MKTDVLIKILGDLNHLKNTEESELIELSKKYPYVQNFRFLIAKKKQLSNNTDNLKAFQELSSFISDKSHLYDRFAHSECENSIDVYQSSEIDKIIEEQLFPSIKAGDITLEDSIEQKPIKEELIEEAEVEENDEIQKPKETTPAPIDQEKVEIEHKPMETDISVPETEIRSTDLLVPIDEDNDELDFIRVKPFKSKHKNKQKKKSIKKKSKKSKDKEQPLGKRSASPLKKKKKKVKPETIIKNVPETVEQKEDLSSFSAWLSSLKTDSTANNYLEEQTEKGKKKQEKKRKKKKVSKVKDKLSKKSKKNKKKKKDKLQHKIDASLERKPAVVSETLAKIMAKQGHIKEAKNIYNQLILLYPEKSSYFADQIKKLD